MVRVVREFPPCCQANMGGDIDVLSHLKWQLTTQQLLGLWAYAHSCAKGDTLAKGVASDYGLYQTTISNVITKAAKED